MTARIGQGRADYVALLLAFGIPTEHVASVMGSTVRDLITELRVNGHGDVSRALQTAAQQ